MTSQGERKYVDGWRIYTIEDRLSCDDSSYRKCNLEVSDSINGIHSESEDE